MPAVRRARTAPSSVDPRIPAMLERRPARVVTVAAANRTARVAWAIMTTWVLIAAKPRCGKS